MDSFIETFHIDWKIIVAQGINFIIVLFVLFFLIVKPLKQLMKERSESIKGGLNDAKINADNLIFQEGKKEAEVKKIEMMENAKKEVETMISNGKKVLESEKAKIIEEAKKEIVSLVVLSTEKLLESNPDEKFDDKAINQMKKI